MLRLRQAINECGIPQKKIVEATGFGKTQVSLTLSSGKLPADSEKFKSGVVTLVHQEPALFEWLTERSLNVERLFEIVENAPVQLSPPVAAPDLKAMIYTLAGQATIDGGLSRGTSLRLVKALSFLSIAAPQRVIAEAAAILAGGEK